MLAFIASTTLLAPLASPTGWRLTGEASIYGIEEPFEFIADGGTRFKFAVTGTLPDIDAYDGVDCWVLNHSGVPHIESRQERDTNCLLAWVLDSAWRTPGAAVESKANEDGSYALRLRDGTGLVATLTLDPGAKTPASLSYWSPDGQVKWTFDGYRSFGDHAFPTRFRYDVGQEHYAYTVADARRADPDDTTFRMPAPDESVATFDATKPPEIGVKHVFGYTFVHPSIDGQDVGWFFLDTGAGAMVLDAAAAKGLNTTQVGKSVAAGVVATVETPICRAQSFALGPLQLAKPTFLQIDLSDIAKVFGIKIGGVCGYDFLSRVSLVLDPSGPTAGVFPPGKATPPPDAHWAPFEFASNLMCVKCRYEGDRSGYFTIDTGAGSFVDFTSPAVTKYDLLKGRTTRQVRVGGAGGSAPGRSGKLAWFEIDGHRISDVEAGFESATSGVYASPFLDGNVGDGILGKFKLFLDYRSRRFALAATGK